MSEKVTSREAIASKNSSNLPTAENENLINFRDAGSRIWDKSDFGEYMIS